MPHIKDLIRQLRSDYPYVTFTKGEGFAWSNSSLTLTYLLDDKYCPYLLHELAHALLRHADFQLDIELLAQERSAWDIARTELGPRYKVKVNQRVVEDSLDTYRKWLHSRSLCPKCNQTGIGIQNKTSTYVCINCRCSWHPNDARRCALRRSTIV